MVADRRTERAQWNGTASFSRRQILHSSAQAPLDYPLGDGKRTGKLRDAKTRNGKRQGFSSRTHRRPPVRLALSHCTVPECSFTPDHPIPAYTCHPVPSQTQHISFQPFRGVSHTQPPCQEKKKKHPPPSQPASRPAIARCIPPPSLRVACCVCKIR